MSSGWKSQGRDDLQRLTWRRSSPLSCDLLTETVSPCTRVRFFDRYSLSGSPMLFRIEEACHSQSALEALEAPENGDEVDTWEAVYQPFDKTKIKIHAVHLAASLGSTQVLQWLQDHCSPDVLAYQSIIETMSWEQGSFVSDCRMHYSPLLAALFMSQVETAVWILEKMPRTATLTNADGLSPLHIIAPRKS